MKKIILEWSNLHEELVDLIADRVFSNVELLRIRSICKSWRSAVSTKKLVLNDRKRKRSLALYNGDTCLLSPATFFRVVSSSHPKKGWLIKTQEDKSKSTQKLFCPLSRTFKGTSNQTLDLLDYTVSEIYQSYDLELLKQNSTRRSCDFVRVLLVDNLVFAIDNYNKIWWCCSSENSSNYVWTRMLDKEVEYFSDIIVHNGHIYALDVKGGATWWISLSELSIFQYGPSTPLAYYEIDDCKEKRFVEYNGVLCVIHRFCKKFTGKRRDIVRTVGFKIYKMDEEIVEWVEVKSLGEKAIMMATDGCFTVLAREYDGCLENSIYFTDKEEKDYIKVFKLCDGSITMEAKSSYESCFHMFSPPFPPFA